MYETTKSILIADDETGFSESMAALLSKEGHRCETAPDAEAAAEKLNHEQYDLLIADIHMPGNENLELVRHGPLAGTPVLLVTGEPSLESAIESVGLPVAGYLVKPIRFEVLKAAVSRALLMSQMSATFSRARKRLTHWSRELDESETMTKRAGADPRLGSVDAFVETTVRNVSDAILDMARLTVGLRGDNVPESDVCRFFRCPRREEYLDAIDETIEVLEKTKRAFRSKELGALRQRLETLRRTRT